MPPFLEFPLQRPPLRSTTSTGIWPRGCTEALGKHSADCRRCAMWPVLSSPAANKGYHECYVYSPSCQGGCFPSLKSFLWWEPLAFPGLCLSSLTPCHWSWLFHLFCVGDPLCLRWAESLGKSRKECTRRVQNGGWARRNHRRCRKRPDPPQSKDCRHL